MTYEQFIEELRQLITEGEAFRGVANAGTPEFREWRHRAESIVVGIQREGYVVPGGFGSPGRSYHPNWAPAKPEKKREVFDRHLGDSLTELRYIVGDFEKYGPPRSPGTQQVPVAAAPLSVPEKVTFRWLIDHVSVALWWSGLGIVVAALVVAFFIGFAVGQIPAARAVVCWFKPSACSTGTEVVPKDATKPPAENGSGKTETPK